MKKAYLFLLVFMVLEVRIVMGQTCPPGPPTSRSDGTTAGTPVPGGGLQFSFEYAQIAGFDCFERLKAWFPSYIHSSHSISPLHTVLDMAYAAHGTATFFNVVVPSTETYKVTVRYAFSSGLFPRITDRPEGIMVNGVVITSDMHFPITGNFETYADSSIVIPLNAGKNTIQMFNVTDHGVARVDTMTVTPNGSSACSGAPVAPRGLSADASSSSQINLNWIASTAPADCTVGYYNVFRSTTSGFTPSSSNEIASGVTTTSYSDKAAQCATSYHYLVEAVDPAGPSGASNQASAITSACRTRNSAQINSGGSEISPFGADEYFAGGSAIQRDVDIDLSGLTNPAPMSVYQSARTGNFSYTIPYFIAGSTHTVRLHFAETFFKTTGSRTFNVSINGTRVLTNFDIVASAGTINKAVIEQFTENASPSGDFVITFTSVVGNSLVSAIEIE
jgi:malectin (di-glucose binding ER protein)